METQAQRTERLTITATEPEARAIRAVALVRGKDVSTLLRERAFAEVLAEYDRMAEALDTPEAA